MIEAFARVFAKERPIDGKGSFRAYLYKTARNLTIRHTQKHKLWFLHLDEVDFELPSEELVETRLLQNEREKCLYEAMAKLGSLETSSPYSESISRLPGTAFSSEGLYRISTKKGGWSAGSVLPLPLLFRTLFSSHTNSPYAHTPSLLEVISRPAQNPPSWQKGTFNPPPILASRLCRSIFWIFASFPSSGPSVTMILSAFHCREEI